MAIIVDSNVVVGTGVGSSTANIHGLDAKVIPVNADEYILSDSEDTFINKKITHEDLKASLLTDESINLTQSSSYSSADLAGFRALSVRDYLVFTCCNASNGINIINISDENNITLKGKITNEFVNRTITSFVADPNDTLSTIVLITGNTPPRNLPVTIANSSIGAYNGVHSVAGQVDGGFRIPVAFAGDSGTTADVTASDLIDGREIEVVGSTVFWLSTTLTSLYAFDITILESPVLVGVHVDPMLDKCNALRLNGDRAYVSTDDTNDAIQILYIGDPHNIRDAGKSAPCRSTGNVDVKDNILYVGDRTQDIIRVFDARQLPVAPQLGSSSPSALIGSPRNMRIRGSNLYIVDGSGAFSVWDVADPSNITLIGSLSVGGNLFDLQLLERYAFLLTNDTTSIIKVVDISDLTNMSVVFTYTGGLSNSRRFITSGDNLLVSSTDNATVGNLQLVKMNGLIKHSVSAGVLTADIAVVRERLEVHRDAYFGCNAIFNGLVHADILESNLFKLKIISFATDISTAELGAYSIYQCTDLTVARVITISSADISDEGRIFVIKDTSGNATFNNLTITTEGSETIDTLAAIAISANYGVARLYSDGSNLFTL